VQPDAAEVLVQSHAVHLEDRPCELLEFVIVLERRVGALRAPLLHDRLL